MNRQDRRTAEKQCKTAGHKEKLLIKLVGDKMSNVWHCLVCGQDRPVSS